MMAGLSHSDPGPAMSVVGKEKRFAEGEEGRPTKNRLRTRRGETEARESCAKSASLVLALCDSHLRRSIGPRRIAKNRRGGRNSTVSTGRHRAEAEERIKRRHLTRVRRPAASGRAGAGAGPLGSAPLCWCGAASPAERFAATVAAEAQLEAALR